MGARIAVIGGSGLYDMRGVEIVDEHRAETPFGPPSDAITRARFVEIPEVELLFLPRHGRGHRLLPSEVPYRANVFALKALGAGWVISVSAVGSLREEIVPGSSLVLVDQFIDRTVGRDRTFFGRGVAAHLAFGDPVCGVLRGHLLAASREVGGATIHHGGTYVCIEGPTFSTRAESEWYRSMGADVVGMTNLPEARLAREAGLSYATIALPTDYDCWHPHHDDVTVEAVIATLQRNAGLAQEVIRAAIPRVAAHQGPLPFAGALSAAIMTRPDLIPEGLRRELAPILGDDGRAG